MTDESKEGELHIENLWRRCTTPLVKELIAGRRSFFNNMPSWKYFVTVEQKIIGGTVDNMNFQCRSCGNIHGMDDEKRRRLIISDSVLNHQYDKEVCDYDDSHYDVITLSGYTLEKILTVLYECYILDNKPLTVYLAAGMNNILRHQPAAEVIKKFLNFESFIMELDQIHKRPAGSSKIFLGTLPECPKLMRKPKTGIARGDYDQKWCSSRGKQLLVVNDFIKNFNKSRHPELKKKVPEPHAFGWRTNRKSKRSTDRLTSCRWNHWRSSEGRVDAVHPSNQSMREILVEIKKFLQYIDEKLDKEEELKLSESLGTSEPLCKTPTIVSVQLELNDENSNTIAPIKDCFSAINRAKSTKNLKASVKDFLTRTKNEKECPTVPAFQDQTIDEDREYTLLTEIDAGDQLICTSPPKAHYKSRGLYE